jgi:N-acetylglucosamine kinase-like BadF-type ATPase
MMHMFYTPAWPRSRVAELAQIVNRLAEEGDPVAARILHTAAQHLADLVRAVRRQLWSEADPVKVASTGGAFSSAVLVERFRTLLEADPLNRCEASLHGPAVGALLLAWHAGGVVPVLPTGL